MDKFQFIFLFLILNLHSISSIPSPIERNHNKSMTYDVLPIEQESTLSPIESNQNKSTTYDDDDDNFPIISEQDIPNSSSLAYDVSTDKKPTSFKEGLKRFGSKVTNGLFIAPAKFVKKSAIRAKNVFVRDTRIVWNMAKSLVGIRSSTCRYKFLCLFSSFFSLHTPDYFKSNMPTQVENYYIKITEAANRHEFLNALVTGYIGFDCEEFYGC